MYQNARLHQGLCEVPFENACDRQPLRTEARGGGSDAKVNSKGGAAHLSSDEGRYVVRS